MRRVVAFACALGLTATLAPVLQAQPFIIPPFSEDEAAGGIVDLDLTTDAALVLAPCDGGDLEWEALPDGAEGFAIPGQFLEVRWEHLCRGWDLPLRDGVAYRHVTVEFDLYLDRWVSPIFHNITSLRRTSSRRNQRILYYGLVLRGDKRRTLLDFGHERQAKVDGPWREGTTYHLVFDVDVPSKKVNMQVYEGEDLIHEVGGKLSSREIKNLRGQVVRLDFSSGGIAHHAYFPPFGSQYSNLKVTLTPF